MSILQWNEREYYTALWPYGTKILKIFKEMRIVRLWKVFDTPCRYRFLKTRRKFSALVWRAKTLPRVNFVCGTAWFLFPPKSKSIPIFRHKFSHKRFQNNIFSYHEVLDYSLRFHSPLRRYRFCAISGLCLHCGRLRSNCVFRRGNLRGRWLQPGRYYFSRLHRR